MSSGPVRWRAAGLLAAHLPNVRGRDRVVRLARGRSSYSGPVSGRFHNGLAFSFSDVSDGSVRAALSLRYRPPVLAPVLEAVLNEGDCFYDVGANLGIYTMWASPLVGAAGSVHAFEPVPSTRVILTDLVIQNRLSNVTIVPVAVGEHNGTGHIRTVRGASGLAHFDESSDDTYETQVVTLDEYARTNPPPSLLKADVEGHEHAVLAGSMEILDIHRPAIVIELLSLHLARSRTPIESILEIFKARSYELFNLTPAGLRPVQEGGSYTTNVLALRSDVERHSRIASQLENAGFPRNQTT